MLAGLLNLSVWTIPYPFAFSSGLSVVPPNVQLLQYPCMHSRNPLHILSRLGLRKVRLEFISLGYANSLFSFMLFLTFSAPLSENFEPSKKIFSTPRVHSRCPMSATRSLPVIHAVKRRRTPPPAAAPPSLLLWQGKSAEHRIVSSLPAVGC